MRERVACSSPVPAPSAAAVTSSRTISSSSSSSSSGRPPPARMRGVAGSAAGGGFTAVLSWPELAAYLGVVAYFLYVLTTEGLRFCERLVAARVPVPGLAPGLLPGSRVDLSDHQWREFRASLPLLAAALGGFAAASRALQASAPGPAARAAFVAAFGLALLGVLHGAAVGHVLLLLGAGYAVARGTARLKHGLVLVWAWHCAIFLAVRATEGLPFALLSPALAGLDVHRGMLRWHIHYNLLMLRMISFAADYRWAAQRKPGRTAGAPPDAPAAAGQPLGLRAELWQPASSYCLLYYVAYCLYPPLYIAGPILSFNAFASQLAAPAREAVSARAVGRYAVRGAACWAVLEAMSSRLWFMAVVRHKLWVALAAAERVASLAPLDMVLVPWWVMLLFWLKFTVIWRFFRAAALAEGLDVPENMTRCICNHHDVVGFWRSWHASYNRWLVRYMYLPLGGAAWRAANVWVIFTFVALWHDLEPRLLGWAWLTALLFTPELGVKWLGAQPWCMPDKRGRAFRYATAAAATLNVLLLITANMVGFVLGVDGVRPFLAQVLGQPAFLPLVLLAVFSGVQLQFALRDWEAARARRSEAGGPPLLGGSKG